MALAPQKTFYWRAVGLISGAMFLALCWHYTAYLNLWGDEALSLLYAGQGWGARPVDVHLPTYYWGLGAVLAVWGDSSERLLRLLHALTFGCGLGFGLLTVRRTFGHTRLVVPVAALVVTLPSYLFYATNLRMYAPLFLASMAFIDAVSQILVTGKSPPWWLQLWLVVSGTALVCTDYAAGLYYAAGLLMLALHAIAHKTLKVLMVAAMPGVLAVGLALGTLGNLREIQNWDMAAYQGSTWTGPVDLAKGLYLACRPVLDLIHQAPLPIPLALGLPLVLVGLLLWAAGVLFTQAHQRFGPVHWVLLLALLWVPFIPTGFGFTRLFLPSQFFMIVVIVWWVGQGKTWRHWGGRLVVGLWLAINLAAALHPIPRFYSLVPYPTVAADVADYAHQHNIHRVLVGNNSLNTLAFEHYLQALGAAPQLQTERVDGVALAQVVAEHPTEPFIFISHQGENGVFIDVTTLPSGQSQLIQGYVPLAHLPYNRLWNQRYGEGAGQPYIVQTYRLN
ncbi:MAG: hypothetical protein ACFCVD_19480 [Nodosilinea sp.]